MPCPAKRDMESAGACLVLGVQKPRRRRSLREIEGRLRESEGPPEGCLGGWKAAAAALWPGWPGSPKGCSVPLPSPLAPPGRLPVLDRDVPGKPPTQAPRQGSCGQRSLGRGSACSSGWERLLVGLGGAGAGHRDVGPGWDVSLSLCCIAVVLQGGREGEREGKRRSLDLLHTSPVLKVVQVRHLGQALASCQGLWGKS